MKEFLAKKTVHQFIKFAVVGVSSTIVDWGAFYIFNHFLSVFYLVAKVLSFLLAVINSYIWNRSWTFRSQNPNKIKEFVKFIVVSTIGMGLNTLIFYLSVDKIHLTYFPSLFIATAITTIWNFVANKLWVFKEPVVIE